MKCCCILYSTINLTQTLMWLAKQASNMRKATLHITVHCIATYTVYCTMHNNFHKSHKC